MGQDSALRCAPCQRPVAPRVLVQSDRVHLGGTVVNDVADMPVPVSDSPVAAAASRRGTDVMISALTLAHCLSV